MTLELKAANSDLVEKTTDSTKSLLDQDSETVDTPTQIAQGFSQKGRYRFDIFLHDAYDENGFNSESEIPLIAVILQQVFQINESVAAELLVYHWDYGPYTREELFSSDLRVLSITVPVADYMSVRAYLAGTIRQDNPDRHAGWSRAPDEDADSHVAQEYQISNFGNHYFNVGIVISARYAEATGETIYFGVGGQGLAGIGPPRQEQKRKLAERIIAGLVIEYKTLEKLLESEKVTEKLGSDLLNFPDEYTRIIGIGNLLNSLPEETFQSVPTFAGSLASPEDLIRYKAAIESQDSGRPSISRIFLDAVLGAWSEDPAIESQLIDLSVGIIPVVGEAGDARDILAYLWKIFVGKDWGNLGHWLGLALAGIGLVPAVGGIFKLIGRLASEGKFIRNFSKVRDFIRSIDPNLLDVGALRRAFDSRWSEMSQDFVNNLDVGLARMQSFLSRLAPDFTEQLGKFRSEAIKNLKQVFGGLERKFNEILDSLLNGPDGNLRLATANGADDIPNANPRRDDILNSNSNNINSNELTDDMWEELDQHSARQSDFTDFDMRSWESGTIRNVEDSLVYHFEKHGVEVGAETIEDYVSISEDFKDLVLSLNLPSSPVRGSTSNVRRFNYQGWYIDINMSTRGIVSLGTQQ